MFFSVSKIIWRDLKQFSCFSCKNTGLGLCYNFFETWGGVEFCFWFKSALHNVLSMLIPKLFLRFSILQTIILILCWQMVASFFCKHLSKKSCLNEVKLYIIRTLWLPENEGTPCLKQAQYLKFKWLQQESNPQPLSL